MIVAFFSCGTAVQGAGARVAFALARDGTLPFSSKIRAISPRHRTPANAILVGTVVPFLFLLLVLINPSKPVRLLWFDYPAHVNALFALVSFATSGIYLAFFLTVFGALVATEPRLETQWSFVLGRWGIPVTVGGALYLLLMLINIVWPSSLVQRPGDLQLRLGDTLGHGAHRGRRRDLRSNRTPGSQANAPSVSSTSIL